ncbi:MAG: PIN domain-containing protein [Rhodocyclaceae bacterium]|nr:PIN domain-containing protein [Rhodocyclaceae bacterium]
MILADTSVWIDHFRRSDDVFASMLATDRIATHDFVIGELALGGLRPTSERLQFLKLLPRLTGALESEMQDFIAVKGLHGTGIGYVDAHLLACAVLHRAQLWTHDKRLHQIAAELNLAFTPMH